VLAPFPLARKPPKIRTGKPFSQGRKHLPSQTEVAKNLQVIFPNWQQKSDSASSIILLCDFETT
jgi:hypothetical protein